MQPTTEELKELSASLPEEEIRGFLSVEQEKDLIRRFHDGNLNALSELIAGNIRIAITVAKLYEEEFCCLEMREIIAAGVEGLILAAEKYTGAEDFRFISYAIFWIRETILERESDEG